ncbi:MAG: ABC transporter permease [Candidatus Eisenbacteria bacterium]
MAARACGACDASGSSGAYDASDALGKSGAYDPSDRRGAHDAPGGVQVSALRHLVRKEFRQIFRDHTMLRMIFLMPIAQLFVFSYAANTDLRNVAVSFLDQDRTAASRQLAEAFLQSDVFVRGPEANDPEEMQHLIDSGDARLTVWIPRGYAEDLAKGEAAEISITVDGQNSSVAGRAAGYAQAIVLREGARITGQGNGGVAGSVGESGAVGSGTVGSGTVGSGTVGSGGVGSGGVGSGAVGSGGVGTGDVGSGGVGSVGAVGSAGGDGTSASLVPKVTAVTRFFYNPELESRMFMIPGILVLLITVISALLTGMAVVREKEIGTLEQLLVSPLRSWEIIAGKTIPFIVIAYFELCFAGSIAVLWFHLPLRGSVLLLGVSALAYLLVTLGVGLLASTLSQTQQQAMLTVWFFLVFGILMSGFFYPVENMPTWAQWISAADPVRYIMNIVRGIFLRGAGFADLWRDLLVLAGMGILVFGTAAGRFQKRLS